MSVFCREKNIEGRGVVVVVVVVMVVVVVVVVVAVVLSCSWLIFSSPAARPGDLLPALPLLEILGHRSCR